MIRFVEVVNRTDFNPRMERTAVPHFELQEVWINEQYVVSVREATNYSKFLAEGQLPPKMNEGHQFTTVTTNMGGTTETHVVVGAPGLVARRLGQAGSQLLKG